MAIYLLKHKDILVGSFEIKRSDVLSATIYKENCEHLPLPLKRIIHYKDEFVQSVSNSEYVLNEEGCFLFDIWLSEREIPINRDNFHSYVKNGSTARQLMMENYGYSFTDCYWFHNESELINWNTIQQKRDSVDVYSSIKDENQMYKGQNATLGGQLEKFWYKNDNQLKLCKKTGKLYDVLNAREVFATRIYNCLEYKNYCDYEFVKDSIGDIVGCKCQSFTKDNVELITAYDLLEEYNYTQQDDVYEKIIALASTKGLNKQVCSDYMDIQTIVDFLILNRDRHQCNIGFLRDADSLAFLSPAPIYDSGSCKHLEGESPENSLSMKINGLYSTEQELLKHVANFEIVDISLLPDKEEYMDILNQCKYISDLRKLALSSLYEQNVNRLFEIQQNKDALFCNELMDHKDNNEYEM